VETYRIGSYQYVEVDHILIFSGSGTQRETFAIFLRDFLSGEDETLHSTFQNTTVICEIIVFILSLSAN